MNRTLRLFFVTRTLKTAALLLWAALCVPTLAQAQNRVGQVSHLQGMATAQQPSGQYRFLNTGDALQEGDTVTTTEKGYAVLALLDGTKVTLRPSTSYAFERFAHNAGTETSITRLLKGGVRMVTGLVGKRNPDGVQLVTPTATVGIRGTSFDARLCGDDCRQEGLAPGVKAPDANTKPILPVVARVVQLQGGAAAKLPGQPARPLSVGGALYEGDELRTEPGAIAVVGFRDQTKVSINPDTTVRIAAFSHNRPQTPDNILVDLLKGGVRAVTGLVGKSNPEAVKIKTRTSTVGIRGTGMDISCEGPCADPALGPPVASDGSGTQRGDGLFMLTWQGATYFAVGPLEVGLNRVGFIGADGVPRLLDNVPAFLSQFIAPRPDSIEVDWNNLFATVNPTGGDGLYVYVRDGHVYILTGGTRIDLGAGEAGYVGQEGRPERLSPVPGFLSLDPYPLPEFFTQTDGQVLQLFGITLGQPGQEICRF